jgi:hypothetical protein
MAGNQKVATENINEVILRLLKINSGLELDYQTYYEIIKKKLAFARLVGKELPREEDELLRNEFKRVKNKKGRFKVKTSKAKVSVSPSSPSSGGGGNRPRGGKLVVNNSFFQQYVDPVKVRDITEKSTIISRSSSDNSESLKTSLDNINKTLDSIVNTLTDINERNKNQLEEKRKEEENKKRKSKEGELESKTFDGIKKVISVITKPFQSIWDKILNFIGSIILGRVLIKLVNWIADPQNQGKIQSIIRFFVDHWPTLLALYLRFGTGIGKFVGTLTRVLIKGSFKLVKLTAQLAAKAGLKGAGRFAKFLGGRKGRVLATGLSIAGDVAITAGTAYGASKLLGGGDNKNQQETPPTQGFSGGGFVRIPKFAGGGFANFNKIFGGASMGAMFGPMGMLAGAGIGAAASSGVVSGPKGRDKVPAMLTDGEFVMSVGAVNKYGVDTLEAMNAAGGGTNQPQVVGGKTYAVGGGYIGEIPRETKSYRSRFGEDFTSNLSNNQPHKISNHYNSLQNSENILSDQIKINRSNLRESGYRTAPESRMLPATRQSSANLMRVTARTTSGSRAPKSSFNRYRPGATLRATGPGMQNFSELQRFVGQSGTMRPLGTMRDGRFGNLKSLGVEMLADYLMERGFDKINAMIVANKINEGKKLTGVGRENYIEKLRNVVQKEERWQSGIGGLYDAIVGMGKQSRSQKMSESSRAILEGIGSGVYQGGGIKGGWGLKKQEFKDMPKTQIMTDKGRPFVGHKAMRGGKPVYVRGPQPGTGTTNPLEALGRMLNPNAYKENDARIAREKHKEAMVNALENMQAQGMAPEAQARMMKQMGGNLKDAQNDLNYRKKTKARIASGELKSGGRKRTSQEQMRIKISKSQTKKQPPKPLPKPKPKYNPAGGGMGGRRGSGSNPSRKGTNPPSFSPTHSSKSTKTARSTLGVKR